MHVQDFGSQLLNYKFSCKFYNFYKLVKLNFVSHKLVILTSGDPHKASLFLWSKPFFVANDFREAQAH